MARAATTLDSFNAVAELKRRQMLNALAWHEMPVNDLVLKLGWSQPMVSKHLGVLKEVGLVTSRDLGRQRIYRVNGEKFRPVFDWAQSYERFWSTHFDRIKERAERKTRSAKTKESSR